MTVRIFLLISGSWILVESIKMWIFVDFKLEGRFCYSLQLPTPIKPAKTLWVHFTNFLHLLEKLRRKPGVLTAANSQKLSFKRNNLCNFERKFHDRKIFHQFFIILGSIHKSTSYSNLTPELAGLDFAYTPLFQRSRKFYFHEWFF